MNALERRVQAVKAWSELEGDITDELLRAISGAFAMVACADGSLEKSEIDEFLAYVRGIESFSDVDMSALERHFREFGEALIDDYDGGRKLALDAIAAMRGDEEKRQRVVRAAQIALVADEDVKEVEEMVLGMICEALGLDPMEY